MKSEIDIRVTNVGDHYATTAFAGDHQIISDEPLELGGMNKGPTSHQILLSALGTCTAVTLRMYADRKAWPVKKIHVNLHLEKVEVLSGNPEKPMKEEITKITRKIEFEGELTEEQINRLLIISDKCPVHKTLTGKVIIENID